MKLKALVLSISRPKVASPEGCWQLLVLYPVKKFGRIYREKRTVFTNTMPKLHSWIDVQLLAE